MKPFRFLHLIMLLFIITGCGKTPGDIFNGHELDNSLSDDFFSVTATLQNFNSGPQKVIESSSRISLPIQQPIQFNVNTFHREVKDVVWSVNGKEIGRGNDLEARLPTMGVGTLNLRFTERKSGKKHNRNIKLYAFKQMQVSIVMNAKATVCGEVALGVGQTLGSYENEKISPVYITSSVQQVCSGGRARVARVPMNIYDKNTSLQIDLIAPKVEKSSSKGWFCLIFFCLGTSTGATYISPLEVYQQDMFPASATNQLTVGTYQMGNTTITLED